MSSGGIGSTLLASATTTVPDVSVGHLLFQMVIAITVIGGGIWLFGKYMQRRRSGISLRGGANAMRGLSVISRTSLGKDHHVAVVAWGERQLLIGVSGNTITLLADDSGGSAEAPTEESEFAFGQATERPILNLPRNTPSGRPNFLEALRQATLRD